MSREEREIYRNELAKRQQVIKDAKLPVIVLLEGWGASGKGSVLASMVTLHLKTLYIYIIPFLQLCK